MSKKFQAVVCVTRFETSRYAARVDVQFDPHSPPVHATDLLTRALLAKAKVRVTVELLDD